VRLYVSLVNQRTVWCQRIHAELYHHGVAVPEGAIRTVKTRAMLADDALELSPAARERIEAGYRMIDATDLEAQPLKRELQRFGARQPACRALVEAQYGIGGLIAVAVWSELGDCRRFCRSEQVVRHTGLDVTVDSSDRRRAGGFLSRQGPETLRWALYEAAKNSSHHRSPDHDYYAAVKERHDGKIAAISVARQFARRCYHVLRNLDPDIVYAIPQLSTALGSGRWHRPPRHQGQPRSAPGTGVPASIRAGRPSNTDATALPTTGGHPITIVVADDTNNVEHLGNAGRPHAATSRAKAKPATGTCWTRAPHTGNAGTEPRSRSWQYGST
jgi:transposase